MHKFEFWKNNFQNDVKNLFIIKSLSKQITMAEVTLKSNNNGSGNYTTKQKKIMKEVIGCIKAVIAVSCHVIQFSKETTSRKEIWSNFSNSYHGTKEIVSQVKQCLKGEGRFGLLFEKQTEVAGKRTVRREFFGFQADGILNVSPNTNPLIASNLRSSTVWTGKEDNNITPLSGRTICNYYQVNVIAKAKKLTALWLLAYPAGIPSGLTKEDCLLHVLKAYYVEHDEKKGEKVSTDDDEDSDEEENGDDDDDDEEEDESDDVKEVEEKKDKGRG